MRCQRCISYCLIPRLQNQVLSTLLASSAFAAGILEETRPVNLEYNGMKRTKGLKRFNVTEETSLILAILELLTELLRYLRSPRHSSDFASE